MEVKKVLDDMFALTFYSIVTSTRVMSGVVLGSSIRTHKPGGANHKVSFVQRVVFSRFVITLINPNISDLWPQIGGAFTPRL